MSDPNNLGYANNTTPNVNGTNLPKLGDNEYIQMQGTTITLGALKNKLREKSTEFERKAYAKYLEANSPSAGVNNYKNVLLTIDIQPDVNRISQLLSKYNIIYRLGNIVDKSNDFAGGKKTKRTKKYRKQKGGFTYKKKFRRSGITSNSRYNRSSKSKRSSR